MRGIEPITTEIANGNGIIHNQRHEAVIYVFFAINSEVHGIANNKQQITVKLKYTFLILGISDKKRTNNKTEQCKQAAKATSYNIRYHLKICSMLDEYHEVCVLQH
jgi:hypothetical protein